ncbi:hypothetical protein [Pseudonocardia asaccharolytica]|uniref:Uncharacterized protein n=1 Tax=Pseudonocardia asaccharolytica DSM 44247 = NBRC 16224 TaxID=1123024 RepID=A0A511CYP8_9PSEU|nr:hypothetical protein [Pseudonocardia asaccharolytica]GEL17680.1 hypothetical protein PA7_15170 [Pseudonocardia asaccharolytica DSM 44247 = NBRC 16224]
MDRVRLWAVCQAVGVAAVLGGLFAALAWPLALTISGLVLLLVGVLLEAGHGLPRPGKGT